MYTNVLSDVHFILFICVPYCELFASFVCERISVLIGHQYRIYSLRYLGNNILASVSYEGNIIIWNLVNRRQTEITLRAHMRPVSALEPLTNDGTLFASGAHRSHSRDNYIKVWNLLSQQCVRTLSLDPLSDVNALVWLGKVDEVACWLPLTMITLFACGT